LESALETSTKIPEIELRSSDLKAKLQDYALIAEIVSALAVVAGLIFVGLEIRQSTDQAALNTRAIEVASYQDLIGQIIDINKSLMLDPSLVNLIRRGQAGELTDPDELEQYRRYNINVARHADLACFQYQQGIINKERLRASIGIFLGEIYRYTGEAFLKEVGAPGLRECIEIAISVAPAGSALRN